MTSGSINSKKPVAVIYSSEEGGHVNALADGLACAEFSVTKVGSLSELVDISLAKNRNLGAIILDLTSGSASPATCLEAVDPVFLDAGGPVIAFVEDEANVDEAALQQSGINKIVDLSLGQRALRLIVAIEIEEFARIRKLKSELRRRSSAIGQIVQGEFRFRTRREAQNLATMLSMTCPNPMPIAIGLAELFINGVEHGCLGIGHDEKGRLIEEGRLAEEIARRRFLPEYADRFVNVVFRREPNRLCFTIKDGGKGFDFQSYVSETEGHSKKHGRGIMMAKGCFEELIYKGNGNEVYAVHYFGSDKA